MFGVRPSSWLPVFHTLSRKPSPAQLAVRHTSKQARASSCGYNGVRAFLFAYNCENVIACGRIAAAQTDVIAAAPCAAFSLPCWRTPPQRSTS